MSEEFKNEIPSAEIDQLLNEAEKNGLMDEISMGPDGKGKINAEAPLLLERLNALGWLAEWQKNKE